VKRRAIIRRLAAITIGISIAITIFALPVVRAGVESTGVGSTFGGGGGSGITIAGTTIMSGTNGRVLFQCSETVCEDADLTFLTDTLTATKIVGSTSITDTGLTAGRMTFAGTAGILTDDSDCTFATDTLTCTKIGSTTLSGTNVATGDTTFGSAAGAADAVDLGETAGRITFEGATADAFEGRLGWTDPTVGDQVILLPNLAAATTDTLVTLAAIQTLTGKTYSAPALTGTGTWTTGSLTFSDGTAIALTALAGGPRINVRTEITPDAPVLATGTTANTWHIAEAADGGYDFQNCSAGTSAATDPLLCIHSHTQGTTGWISFFHNDTNGVIDVGSGVVSIPDGVTTAGTLKGTSATGAGWTIGAAANQACNTTCQAQAGTPACAFGFNVTAGNVTGLPLLCTDATADTCVCLG
jgi:hypothetical protein